MAILSIKNLPQNPILFAAIIIAWGILLRSLFFTSYPFGFDQIQIAQNASQIAQGDLKLIGPRTGPAEMFTGPLIYYLAAPFTYLITPAQATLLVAIAISLLTGIGLVWLSHRYLNPKITSLIIMLWAFSPLLIHFDRIPWNPNLTLLAAACVFFPLLKTKPLNIRDSLVIAIGVFLGYQAHFSGLLLLPLCLLSLFTRKQLKLGLLPTAGFLISLLPTILFDYRHHWLNLTGFTNLISNKDHVAIYALGGRLFQKIYIVLETIGKYLLETNRPVLIISVGILITTLYFYTHSPFKKGVSRTKAGIILTWFSALIFVFSLYRASTPEYYFFLLLPPIIYMIAVLIAKSSIPTIITFLILGLYASYYTIDRYHQNPGLTYGNIASVVEQIEHLSKQQPIKSLIFDMEPVDTLGLQYFLSQKPPILNSQGIDLHIAHPASSQLFTTARIGDITLWLDPRQTPAYHYMSSHTEIIGIPESWQILEVKTPPYPAPGITPYQIVIPDSTPLSLLHLSLKHTAQLPQAITPPQASSPIPLKNKPELLWQPAQYNQTPGYYLVSHPQAYFIATQSPDNINQIEIIPSK